MIDLHMHSQESDGSLSPVDLAKACSECGVIAAALTDHDTLSGCRAFVQACSGHGIRGIAAVELSADYEPGTLHMLGYIPDASIESLQAELLDIQASRASRNHEIIEALRLLGYPLDFADVLQLAGDGMMGRPHIASAMVQRGYVKTHQEAFSRFLGKGCPAYRDRLRLAAGECIRMIRDHGGVAVLAHPFTMKLSDNALSAYVSDLVGEGLGGIEVFYPEHNDSMRKVYWRLAEKHGLIKTGGSDFHGDLNPAIRLGRGFGNVFVADSVLDDLDACFASVSGLPPVEAAEVRTL